MGKLLTTSNPKTMKGSSKGYLTAILHLAPFNLSGKNLCSHASAGCAAACLNTAGRGRFDYVQNARIRRSHELLNDRNAFLAKLTREIGAFLRKCERASMKPAIRLNGTSDLVWESIAPNLFDLFRDVSFYDYTKDFLRMLRFLDGKIPQNYHLTFSASEHNDTRCGNVLERGGNVAVVFDSKVQPNLYVRAFDVFAYGTDRVRTIDGDDTDLRFLDPRGNADGMRIGMGNLVCLYAKGQAKKDETGFVRTLTDDGNVTKSQELQTRE